MGYKPEFEGGTPMNTFHRMLVITLAILLLMTNQPALANSATDTIDTNNTSDWKSVDEYFSESAISRMIRHGEIFQDGEKLLTIFYPNKKFFIFLPKQDGKINVKSYSEQYNSYCDQENALYSVQEFRYYLNLYYETYYSSSVTEFNISFDGAVWKLQVKIDGNLKIEKSDVGYFNKCVKFQDGDGMKITGFFFYGNNRA